MASETAAAPSVCAIQLQRNADLMRETGRRLCDMNIPFAATLARGSSDHAAAFAKALLEIYAGIPTLSHMPSIGSLYHATSPRFRGVPLIAISQSGRSPDLLRAAEEAQARGAILIAIVNDETSPLAALADITIPIHAGTETSVAATKSYIATLTALTHLVAEWTGDRLLLETLASIGDTLSAAHRLDWSAAIGPVSRARSMLVLGRGLTLPIASEAALKLKETSSLHAEAFSTAEVAHGPMRLIGADDPVLLFGPLDVARTGIAERIADFAQRGTTIIATGLPEDIAAATIALPSQTGLHPAIGAIACIQSFYTLANSVAIDRGHDPDRPPHLAKVTRTL